jgi:hypothetical protein
MFIKRAFLKQIYKAVEELKNNNEESISTSESLFVASSLRCKKLSKTFNNNTIKYILLSFDNFIKFT